MTVKVTAKCVECGEEAKQERPVLIAPKGKPVGSNKPYTVWSRLCSDECRQVRQTRVDQLTRKE